MTTDKVVVLVLLGAPWLSARCQTPESPATRAQLEMTAEVATTTDDGYPSTLRVTIRNVGGEIVDMPALTPGCGPDNGLRVDVAWISDDEQMGSGSGGWCSAGDKGSLLSRIQREWIRLRPGELMTETISLLTKYDPTKSGTVSYSVTYIPPSATKAELAEARSAGYVLPAKTLYTGRQSLQIR